MDNTKTVRFLEKKEKFPSLKSPKDWEHGYTQCCRN